MTIRVARALISLYPETWQKRYAEEFIGFLEDYPATPRTLLNVVRSVVYERFLARGASMFRDPRHATVLVAYALLMAFAAATNLYWTLDDSPFATHMRTDSTLALCWFLVIGGSLLALLAGTAVGFRVLVAIVTSGRGNGQRSLAPPFLFILIPSLITFFWFAGVFLRTGGHWAPMPWAVIGSGRGWPDIHTRWTLAFVSLTLLIATMIFIAIGVERILQGLHQRLNLQPNRFSRVSALVIAVSILLMFCGCFGFGLLLYAWPSFHQQGGGILNSSPFESWLISCLLFVAAGIAVVLDVEQPFRGRQA